jgi:putative phage-type endonuclease
MNRETVVPTDNKHWHELRSQVITSTDVAALFGISPWMTEFELWHRKKNATIVELETNERMKWGNRLQDAIANGIAEDYKLTVRPMKEFITIPTWRMGSSFDFLVTDGPVDVLGMDNKEAILEVKNVDGLAYKDGWIVNGDFAEAPPHIEIQVQHELLVSGRNRAIIGPLVGGNRARIIIRDADAQIQEAIKTKVAAFWASIAMSQEPRPDFKADAAFIAKLNGYAEPGKIKNAAGDDVLSGLCRTYKEWGEKEKEAKKEKDGVRAQILTLIEDAEKVYADGFTITAGLIPPTLVEAFTKKGYRDFKVYAKKGESK